MSEFSFRTRSESLRRFGVEKFDVLIVGGGITGAAVARDAVSRGLRVALVERADFASGTSSSSSKLIHGGLRYLENFEFHLVFEALAERSFLLSSAPHLVRPLKFFLPVYRGDPHGRGILSLGLWLYDLLALFRAPGFHRRLGSRAMQEAIPALKSEGLLGGFSYYDASMWDDALAVETLRAASDQGAAIASYLEAREPIRDDEGKIRGFVVEDRLASGKKLELRAEQVVVCAGPWTDRFCGSLSRDWEPRLSPSQGVHLVLDHRRLPVPGALVMSHPEDGRISFVIPRPDYGDGVTIVGTTDGPVSGDEERPAITAGEVSYLLRLLKRYFPTLGLGLDDVLSAYVGIRPLVKAPAGAASLQKLSREHEIGLGPGGVIWVAGGKYTTHRQMGAEIVNFMLKHREREGALPERIRAPRTRLPVNPLALAKPVSGLPAALVDRYGAEAQEIVGIGAELRALGLGVEDPPGFPELGAQLVFAIRHHGVLRLEDFYLRRLPLYLALRDHGWGIAPELARIWARELGASEARMALELEQLRAELGRRSSWRAPAARGLQLTNPMSPQ